MRLRFSKMHGLGNDFVVIDAVSQAIAPTTAQMAWLADRHFGVGCDQILLVEATTEAGVDFRYRIFNADGGEVEQCGNGARCFVRFVHEQGLSDRRELRVATRAGVIRPRLEADGQVTVDMGVPRLCPGDVPFVADPDEAADAVTHRLQLAQGDEVLVSVVSMGNPHAVQVVADIRRAPVRAQGAEIECHPRFPARVNAGFMEVVDAGHIRLRVFERGAGETLACGTGACAAVVSGILRGVLQSPVRVSMRGGELSIAWAGVGQPVWMSGPAETVFTGELPWPPPGLESESES